MTGKMVKGILAVVVVSGGLLILSCGTSSGLGTTNQWPHAVIVHDYLGTNAPVTVNLDGTQSNDPDGTIVSHEWDFDYTAGNFTSDATGSTAPHLYDSGGTYVVALKVTDDGGKFAIGTVTLDIQGNQRPDAVINADVTAGEPTLTVNFDTIGTSDPDAGDTLSYEWDFNYDGTNFVAEPTYTSDTAQRPFDTIGDYTVAVRVTDDGTPSASDIATIDITVAIGPVNNPPVITVWSGTCTDSGAPPTSVTITTDGTGPNANSVTITSPTFPVTVSPTITASDPDSDPITYQWEFSPNWGWESNPIPGQTTNSLTSGNTVSAPGVYYAEVLVSDDRGGSVFGQLTVIVGGFVEAEFFITDEAAGTNFPGPFVDPSARPSGGNGRTYIYRCQVGDTLYFHNDTLLTTGTLWDFGDGTMLADQDHPSHSYTVVGIYHVTFTVNHTSPSLADIAHGIVAVGDASHTIASHLVTWDPTMLDLPPDPSDGDYSASLTDDPTPPAPVSTSPMINAYHQIGCLAGTAPGYYYYGCYHVDIAAMAISSSVTVDHAVLAPYVGREQAYGGVDEVRAYELIGAWGPGDPITAADFPGGAPPNPPDTNYLLSTMPLTVGAERLDWGEGGINGNHESPPYHPLPLPLGPLVQSWIDGSKTNYGVGVTFNDASTSRPFYGRYILSNTGRSSGWPFGMGGPTTLFVEPIFIVIYH